MVTIVTRVMVVTVAICAGPQAIGGWGGTLSGSLTSSRIDTVSSTGYDQQYTVYTTGSLTPRITYLLNGRYRHIQSRQTGAGSGWLTELQPSGSLVWTNALYSLRGEHTERFYRDGAQTNELTGRTTAGHFQTNWQKLPRLHANAEWVRNLNDLELIGTDTRSRALGAGTSYSTRRISVLYNFSDRLTRNAKTQIDRISQSHVGRLDHLLRLGEQAASLETSYQILNRREQDRDRRSGETLIPLPAAGLYAADPTPDFDALTGAPGLVDGALETPAAESYDLSGTTFHNFGLDFGAAVLIDHLYVYTDTLANPDLRWSIWTSVDNQTWTRQVEPSRVPFTPVFKRYEVSFTAVETRYIKLAVEPALAVLPVYVTELRGFVARGAGTVPETATDQRGSTLLRVQPAKWLSVGVGGNLARLSSTQTSLAREEDGLQGTLRLAPGHKLELTSRVDRSRTRYPESQRAAVTTELRNLALRWMQSAALTALVAADQRTEYQNAARLRRSQSGRCELRTLIFPALRGVTQFLYTEDHRFDNPDVYFTRTYGQSLEGEPTPRSTLAVDARYYDMSARRHAVPAYRESLTGRASYHITRAWSVLGQANYSREPGRDSRGFNGMVGWEATRKLSLAANVDRLDGQHVTTTTQYSVQGFFRWTTKTDLSFTQSLTQQTGTADIHGMRFGLNSRF